MVLREFTYGVDNVTATIRKEDKQNVDTMTLITDFTVTANIGDEIKFYDENNELAFAGYIERRNVTGSLELYCEDYGSILKRSISNNIYVDQLPEEIIEDVVTNAGLTYVSTITSTETIPTYVANKKNSQEITEELADRLLANYATDVNGNFRLELEGGVTNTKTIDNEKSTINGTWEEDITELVNDIYVEGDDRSVFTKEDSFNGTGSQTEFVLSEIPIDVRVETPVGTLKTGYVEGQSTGDYQIIREQKKIIFDTAPSSGTNNVFVSYTSSVPVSSRRRNKTSIDSLGGDPQGVRSSIVRKNWIITREDARAYANYVIENFSNPLVNSTWDINLQSEIIDWQNYNPNEKIFVNDDLRGFSGFYIIRKIERKYGTGKSFRITVGSPERNLALWDKQVADRIRQLEQRDNNSTIINEDEFISESIIQQFDIQISDIEKRTFASDTFYLEENSLGLRNQMVEAGTGPVMRETGYTTTDVTETSVGSVNFTYMTNATTNFIATLSPLLTHIAVGDDDTTPTVLDTALGNETFREALFDTVVTTSNSISINIFLDTSENNSNDIKETGVFDAASSGNMYSRSLTNVISKDSSKEVFIELQYNFSTENTDL